MGGKSPQPPGRAASPPTGAYSLAVGAVCLAGWSLANMDQSFFGYAVQPIREEFDASLLAIGNILSAAFVLAACTVPLVGLLADRYGRKAMFVLCLGLSALLVGLQGFAGSLAALAVLRCLAFAVSTGLVPITNAYVVESAPARLRGMFAGILQCGYPLGWFIAALVAPPLLAGWGWRAIFLPALAVVPLAFLMGRFLPESNRFQDLAKQRETGAERTTALERLRLLGGPALRRRAVLGALAFFCYGGAYAGTAFYFPAFFQEVRGYALERAISLVGFSYGAGILGYLGASLVGEFLTTRRNAILIWSWTGAAALIALVWPQHSYAWDMFWFAVMAAFFYGTSAVLTTYVAEIFPTRLRATAVAVVAGVSINLGFAIFPVLVAVLIERLGLSWQWAFTLVAAPCLLLVGAATAFQPNLRSGTELD